MKSTKTLYWIFTGLFGAFMLFSGIINAISTSQSVDLITGLLGYPLYVVPFVGVAKILGVIAILVPGYPRIKEWAYAGLAFDLIAATYSMVAVNGFKPDMLGMSIPFVHDTLSYLYYHKRLKT